MTPKQPAATLILPLTSEPIAMRNPSPSAPSKFAAGISTSVISNMAVFEVGMPILARRSSTAKPLALVSTTKALTRFWPLAG